MLTLFQDSNLIQITAVAINPGNLSDSRALQTNTPSYLYYLSNFVIHYLRPLLRLMDPAMRTSAEASADVIDLATESAFPKQRGYYTLLKEDQSAPESRDEGKRTEAVGERRRVGSGYYGGHCAQGAAWKSGLGSRTQGKTLLTT